MELELPSVCSKCLGNSEKLTLIRDLKGSQCTLCTRPYPYFSWRKHTKVKEKTRFCPSCAEQNNCCQCCYRNYDTGLSFAVHQAAKTRINATPQLLKHAALTAETLHAQQVSKREYDQRLATAAGPAQIQSPAVAAVTKALEGYEDARKLAHTTFLVVNIDPTLAVEALRAHLERYGAIESLCIEPKARAGTVEFRSAVIPQDPILVEGHKLRLAPSEIIDLRDSHREISGLILQFMRK